MGDGKTELGRLREPTDGGATSAREDTEAVGVSAAVDEGLVLDLCGA